jgi:aryl-alcohol dehydrogenase-like predicted oxidoreductase
VSTSDLHRFGVGLAALGRPAYINLGRTSALPPQRDVEAMRAASWAVLDDAYAAGIRWVDAARSYGRAEEFLAGWLAERGHTDVTVSSKWGYAYVGDWRLDADVHEVKEHTAERFRAQWAQTTELLDGRVSLYQVHSLTGDSPLFGDAELLTALRRLADGGVRLGFSTSGPRQADTVRRALELRAGDAPLFTAVQSTWNLLEPSAGPALAEAHAGGAHVLVKEPLANGRLVVDPPAEVADLAKRNGVGPDAIALAAAAAQPWAGTVLLGPASTAQLAANLRAARLEVDAGTLGELAEEPATYWQRRSALAWT